MKKSFILIMILIIFSLSLVLAAQNPSIWVTLDSCGSYDDSVEDLVSNDHLFINGAGFGAANQQRPWSILGNNDSCNPNMIIASGNLTFDNLGNACVDAYIINQNNCGDYKIYIGPRFTNITVINEPPVVPEFSTFLIPLTLIASLLTYFVLIKK